MKPLDYLLQKLGLRRHRKSMRFEATIMHNIRELSLQQNRPFEDVTADLLALGLEQQKIREETAQTWETLTPREKDVAALACLGFTNQQIAQYLTLAPDTVKAHMSNVFRKFKVHGRKQLAQVLKGWDFSAWLDRYGSRS